ncbi:MAG: hypothetical protein KGL48_15070 [Sphingomonadales bacterium]|nr:hypothetical protein [Sphingomonadales bacterium]MDE2567611.1 hypothetical protein [Sphingomonadales bacterium]
MTRLFDSLTKPRLMKPLFWVLVAVALFFALAPARVDPIRINDKLQHMAAFFVLTGVALLAWPRISRLRLVVVLSLYGALIEVLQAIPTLHRDSDWHDWAADTVAILIAVPLGTLVLRHFRGERT